MKKESLQEYLISNAYTPVYVVTTEDEIQTKLLYDGRDIIGYSYLQADGAGEPYQVTIPLLNFGKFLSKINDQHILYTVEGMADLLDSLDKNLKTPSS